MHLLPDAMVLLCFADPTGKTGGNVRVLNRRTAERTLLKDFNGKVTDISFAHVNAVILGAVDEIGCMFIYEIVETAATKITYP